MTNRLPSVHSLIAFAIVVFVCTASLFAAPVVLTPTADSYVKNSTPTTNYGTALNMIANNANGVRVSFLRFNLSGISKPITSAKLELTIAIAASGQDFSIYALSPAAAAWTEAGITWNNAPGIISTYTTSGGTVDQVLNPADLALSGSAFSTFTSGATGIDTAFNVTSGPILDFLNAATGDVTLLIAEPGPVDSSGVGWNTREASSGQPQLTLSSDPVVAPVVPSLIRVVLVGGQSNADGRAAGSGLPTSPINYQATQDNVPFYYYTYGAAANSDGSLGKLTTLRTGATQTPSGGFGPEIGLGYDLSRKVETSPRAKLAIIKYAKGGSSLYSDWKAGGDATTVGDGPHYQVFQQVITAGLASLRAAYPTATVQIAGMIWVQGESDIDGGAGPSAAYGANLTAFIADVRATFSSSMPFVLSRISANQTVYSLPTDGSYANYLTVRGQQQLVANSVPAVYMIDTDSTAFAMNSDNLHFGPLGQLALGQAFAAQFGQLVAPLRVTACQFSADGVHLTWNASPLASYRVWSSSDLLSWSVLYSGSAGNWTDPNAGNVTARFYKVEQQ